MQRSGYVYLAIIYLVWGTTYLAMRIGVEPGSGFPVFIFGATRCLAAAGLLLLIARLRTQPVRVTRAQLGQLALTGVGMWVLAHGMVLVAERTISSGFAAVSVATSPIWVLLISAYWDRKRPNPRHLFYVAVGFLGVAALMTPVLRNAGAADWLSVALLIVSPFIWAYCALYVSRNPMKVPTLTASGYQHLFGGLGFLTLSWIFREPLPSPTGAAWGAWAFLVVFGSVIAFSAYLKALEILPAYVVTTNTYVNPIIAVFLGWVVLKETITFWTVLAMVLVVISVSGILSLTARQAKKVRV